MSPTSLAPPTFDLPSDNSNYEVWCLRAPAHLDISEVLNGVTLNVNTKLLKDTSTSSTTAADTSTNSTLTKFKSKQDGQDYELTIGDASEINHLRLLLPNNQDTNSTQKQLKAHNNPFQRYINLTSVTTSSQEELVLAPARENAPRPAFGEMMGVNGSVPAMRLAYVPVPQKEGLKRRWAMPGSGMMAKTTGVKRVKVDDEANSSSVDQQQPATPDSKGAKKKKKDKKEKKSKKSPKKK